MGELRQVRPLEAGEIQARRLKWENVAIACNDCFGATQQTPRLADRKAAAAPELLIEDQTALGSLGCRETSTFTLSVKPTNHDRTSSAPFRKRGSVADEIRYAMLHGADVGGFDLGTAPAFDQPKAGVGGHWIQ